MAEELLSYMDKAYRTGVHPNAKPDSMGYAHVVQAYARSGEPGSALKAERLLQNLKDRFFQNMKTEVKPDRSVYNAVRGVFA